MAIVGYGASGGGASRNTFGTLQQWPSLLKKNDINKKGYSLSGARASECDFSGACECDCVWMWFSSAWECDCVWMWFSSAWECDSVMRVNVCCAMAYSRVLACFLGICACGACACMRPHECALTCAPCVCMCVHLCTWIWVRVHARACVRVHVSDARARACTCMHMCTCAEGNTEIKTNSSVSSWRIKNREAPARISSTHRESLFQRSTSSSLSFPRKENRRKTKVMHVKKNKILKTRKEKKPVCHPEVKTDTLCEITKYKNKIMIIMMAPSQCSATVQKNKKTNNNNNNTQQ